jgi:hypothetical protein
MNPKYCAVFERPRMNPTRLSGLSESQLIKTMLEQGIHTVSSITHDEESSGKVCPVEGKELISIWKQVHGEIQSRRGKATMQGGVQ